MIDEIDRQILEIVQQDARIANAEIARQVGLAPSAVLERLRKLEERGVIREYATTIDSGSVGCGLTAFVFVKTKECLDGTDLELAKIPEVLEVHDVAGDDSYLLKVKTKDPEALGRLLREKLKPIGNVLSTRTTIVLQTIKETTALPLDEGSCEVETKKSRAKKS
ncbi:MAG: Lrp/AsnC family transcriptional regulator [Pyrinomonadaceae bacterium]|nr:Lrp/AsnC family transcriptional regulator [Pyrinomonadaceae bacterium]